MRTSADTRKISLLLKMEREGSLIPTPEFQRRAVWTNPDKIAFVETILSGFPFPEIYTAAGSVDTTTGEAVELLVDGQQRIRTIKDYFNGTSPFRSSRAIRRYLDLEEDEKKAFLNYDVAVRNLGLLEEGRIREVFRRMNRTSYSLNDMERFNAVYLGLYKRFSETLAENAFLKDVRLFSSTDIRRMKDVSYMASLVATMMSSYFNRDDEVETYLENYNDTFPKLAEMNARVEAVFDYMRALALPTKSRAWRKVDFYNLAVEIDRQLFTAKRRPDPASTSAALTALYDGVDRARSEGSDDEGVQRYFEATLQNTNDRSQRIARGEVLRAIIDAMPHEPFAIEIPAEQPQLTDLAEMGDEEDFARAIEDADSAVPAIEDGAPRETGPSHSSAAPEHPTGD